MSDTDSFIDEVTEEVRRDRLFAFFRKWAWLAVLIILALVGGTGWNEYRKNTERTEAQNYGDALLAALETPDAEARMKALEAVKAPNPASEAVQAMLEASEQAEAAPKEAAERLMKLSKTDGVEQIYRQIAILKAVTMAGSELSLEDRKAAVEGLALGQGMIRLLANEQLALIKVETGDTDAAIAQFREIVTDAEASENVKARAAQMIIALGGEYKENIQN